LSYARIKGIIFDLGSTLIEFENRPWAETTLKGIDIGYRLLTEEGHRLPPFDEFASSLMAGMDALRLRALETMMERQATDAPDIFFAELGLKDPKDISRRFMDKFYNAVTEQMTACEGAAETLSTVNERGYKTGLISNTPYPRANHEADLDRYGLKSFLDFRIYSSEVGLRKPHPDIFLAGREAINLAADEIIYVGDSYKWDVVGARQAGMKPVLIYWEGRDYPDPMPDGFPVIHRLPELLDLLDG
jgi:putative hydrolase of the HAD superfamily